METDILIVGSGCSGLYMALKLPRTLNITIITKKEAELSDSFLAQGGICMLKDESDYDSFFEDTLKAGHYENDPYSVELMIKTSPSVLEDLLAYGCDFNKNEDGTLAYTKEGAHSKHRILYHKDITGKEITSKLLAKVKTLSNVTILEHTPLTDLIVKDNVCLGGICNDTKIYAKKVVLATGGIGGLYKHSTNYPHLTGDSITLAKKYNIDTKNLDYVQIHPTTLYSTKKERSFLISESVRGEGAILLDIHGNRFVDELLPRDVVTKAIYEQMEKDHSDYVYEDLRTIDKEELSTHFPNIIEHCKEMGYDVFKEPIPVVPAQHYFMGGIKVDYDSHTSMKHLYAIGETACNGVHGKNRLASNSLLESLVFALRAAKRIEYTLMEGTCNMIDQTTLKLNYDPLIIQALQEDISQEDVSTNSIIKEYTLGSVDLICKEDGIICGLQIFERVFKLLDETTKCEFFVSDGMKITKGEHIGRIIGDIRVLLSGERVALNYLQRMSGIASYTYKVASLLEGTNTKLLDTRKTTPNNRIFEKYAVKVGGGNNHRYNLSDGVMLKDNHISAAGGINKAVELARSYAPFVRKIEVEVETFEMVKEAVQAKADIIMLDNMNDELLQKSIEYINHQAQIEISGNVTKENIQKYITLGVDFISSGALTHSAGILDLSLKNLHPIK